MQKIWRILSIDGGGTRGVIPATILAAIEKRTGKPISQLFDLIAGTSTGGILALGLTKPNASGKPEFSAQQCCDLYRQEIPKIFRNPQSWWGNLLSPKYRSSAFQQVLKNAFADCRSKSALADVLIPCYDIENRLPYLFKTQSARLRPDCNFRMRDVALAASASPTLFVPVRIPRLPSGTSICLVDGGVFANNPSVTALSEIKSMRPSEDEKYLLVSLGTGKSTRRLSDEFVSLWGYVHWSRPMLELVLESSSESGHEQMRYLLPSTSGHQYYRLQVDLPDEVNTEIDTASEPHMQALTQAAQDFCSASQELDNVCELLFRLSEQDLASIGATQSST